MTFFGVNYYLSGMHSYAQGAAPSIPKVIYIVLAGIVVVLIFAYRSEKKVKQKAVK
jgi:purine-cytosine permease-like protein